MKTLRLLNIASLAASLLVAAAAAAADPVSPNDAARFLAGMPPAADSPLVAPTRERAWQQHSRFFDAAFGQVEKRQLARIHAWSERTLTVTQPTMFYMFSGPDFLYADAFFPKATTYVLSGLEPVGTVPDLTKLTPPAIGAALHHIEYSLSSLMSYSFFITRHMRSDLHAGQVDGTLPLLYVFLARSGKTIREVAFVKLDEHGGVHPDSDAGPRSAAHGVKIMFAGPDGEARTLYYFSTDLGNGGVKTSGFLKFCETLAPGDGLIKSASYLLYSGGFSTVRDFLLAHTALMVQDDSGIPLSYYDAKTWQFHPFGRYLGPISIFPGRYQAQYAAVFRRSQPIDFGIGYRWRPNESNLLLAIRTAGPPSPPTLATPANAPTPPADEAATNSVPAASPAPIRAAATAQRAGHEPASRQRLARNRRSAEPPAQGFFQWLFALPGHGPTPATRYR